MNVPGLPVKSAETVPQFTINPLPADHNYCRFLSVLLAD